MGTEFEIFKAVFKSPRFQSLTEDILAGIEDLGPVNDQQQPQFICIRSQAEARHYVPQQPAVWQKCSGNQIAYDKGRTLFICPSFFNNNYPLGGKTPEACPFVSLNRFHYLPGHPQLFSSRSATITRYLLQSYGPLNIADDPEDYDEVINLPLAWDSYEAQERVLSYHLFIERESTHVCGLE